MQDFAFKTKIEELNENYKENFEIFDSNLYVKLTFFHFFTKPF